MSESIDQYLEKFKGGFSGILRWHQLDELWQTIQSLKQSWYIYQIGEPVPEDTASAQQLTEFIQHLDKLLRSDHGEDYCGIVYVDDKQQPSLVKIYDPNNLGSSCGSGKNPPPLPGWTISVDQPTDLQLAFAPPANRRRWWKNLFSAQAGS